MATPSKEMAERLAELLAQSILDDSLKDAIIDNLDKLPEEDVIKLIDALETENDQLLKIASDIETYLRDQEAGWEAVEEDQKNFINEFADKMAQALDDQARIQELKESI